MTTPCSRALPPCASLVGAMLMPSLGKKKIVVFLPNWSPPRIGAPHFQKNNSCGGSNSGVGCVVAPEPWPPQPDLNGGNHDNHDTLCALCGVREVVHLVASLWGLTLNGGGGVK